MTAMARILIADDKKGMREVLAQALESAGHRLEIVSDGEAAVRRLQSTDWDLVITDLRMPKRDGLEVLRAARAQTPASSVIVMTAFGSVDAAVEAMRIGASDFVAKPFSLAEMEAKVGRILRERQVESRAAVLAERDRQRTGRLIGSGAAMRSVRSAIAKVAPTTLPVLVTGESGTGKELVAREVHDAGSRRDAPFVAVNCAALAEGVLESELFGHEKGSFTGATGVRRGRFEIASGGTIFLDEVGEIPPSIQVKLLRVLQEKEIERVGSEQPLKVDVRIIAATNRDLEAEIRGGRFREDLFYRLNVMRIAMPPLRDRLEDLPELVAGILERVAHDVGRLPKLSDDAWQQLPKWRWPGNVRELENVLARAAVLADGETIHPEDLRLTADPSRATAFTDAPDKGLEERVDAFERAILLDAIEREGGNQSRAAERLKLKRSTLQYKLAKHGITISRDTPDDAGT